MIKKVQSREKIEADGEEQRGRRAHPGSQEQHATQSRLMEYSSAGLLRR